LIPRVTVAARGVDQRETVDPIVLQFQSSVDGRPPPVVHPGAAPLADAPGTARRDAVEYRHKVVPRRMTERIALQIRAQSVAKALRPERPLELLHHDRGLVVDDSAVERSRFFQVR